MNIEFRAPDGVTVQVIEQAVNGLMLKFKQDYDDKKKDFDETIKEYGFTYSVEWRLSEVVAAEYRMNRFASIHSWISEKCNDDPFKTKYEVSYERAVKAEDPAAESHYTYFMNTVLHEYMQFRGIREIGESMSTSQLSNVVRMIHARVDNEMIVSGTIDRLRFGICTSYNDLLYQLYIFMKKAIERLALEQEQEQLTKE